jgi:hypothetical protein
VVTRQAAQLFGCLRRGRTRTTYTARRCGLCIIIRSSYLTDRWRQNSSVEAHRFLRFTSIDLTTRLPSACRAGTLLFAALIIGRRGESGCMAVMLDNILPLSGALLNSISILPHRLTFGRTFTDRATRLTIRPRLLATAIVPSAFIPAILVPGSLLTAKLITPILIITILVAPPLLATPLLATPRITPAVIAPVIIVMTTDIRDVAKTVVVVAAAKLIVLVIFVEAAETLLPLLAALLILFLTGTIVGQHTEIVIRELQIIFHIHPITDQLRIARHVPVFFEELGCVPTRAVIDPVA